MVVLLFLPFFRLKCFQEYNTGVLQVVSNSSLYSDTKFFVSLYKELLEPAWATF